MDKKKSSMFFLPIVVIVAFIVLVNLYIVLSIKNSSIASNPIGKRQFDLLKTYMQAESALFYIDQSAKYSAHQTAYELAKKGGLAEPDCGYYYNYAIWLDKENNVFKNCNPSEQDLIDNFGAILGEELLKYLEIYPDALIPGDYDFEFDGNLEISGISREDLVIKIVPDNFAFKPAITSKNPSEIYQQSQQQVPELLLVPAKQGVDIETIQKFHSEVLVQYAELCRRIGVKEPPGVCKSAEQRCCITSGYRHPSRNQEVGGKRNSAHQYGLAIDISARTKEEQLNLIRANEGTAEQPKLFTRVAIYPDSTHVHFDLMPLKEAYNVPYMILSKEKGTTLAVASSISELEGKAKSFGFG